MSPRSEEFLSEARGRLEAARMVASAFPPTALSAAYYDAESVDEAQSRAAIELAERFVEVVDALYPS